MNTLVRTVSPNATRTRPWELWQEPGEAKARYFGYTVDVIERFTQLALVRRADGLSCIVETSDLSEVR